MDQRNIFISYARPDAGWARRVKADLESRGHRCWMDTSAIVAGDQWERSISEGIEQADACLILESEATQRSHWVTRELLFAEKRGRPVIPALLEDCAPRLAVIDRQPVALWSDYEDGLRRLMEALAAVGRRPEALAMGDRRECELAYLRRLQLRELIHIDLYTPLAADARPMGRRVGPMPSPVMRPELALLRRFQREQPVAVGQPRRFEDVHEAVQAAPRVALLGVPGAGKTTALRRLAAEAAARAEGDGAAELPLLARLDRWIEPEEPLSAFLRRELGELGSDLDALLDERRAMLLLDGLNETPSALREAKASEVRELVEANRELDAIVTCRALDHAAGLNLELDTLTILPLDAPRVRDFVHRYLEACDPERGDVRAETLFWRLAGGDELREVWQVWERCGEDIEHFFAAEAMPWTVFLQVTDKQDRLRRERVADPRSLMRLASNPYMLLMLVQTSCWTTGEVPENRASLFDGFVEVLLVREGLARSVGDRVEPTREGSAVLQALGRLAWTMQTRQCTGEDQNVRTALETEEAERIAGAGELHHAAAASLMAPGAGGHRFSHPLLQDYFAARSMRQRLNAGELQVGGFWPSDCWWDRSGWEDAAVFLAGLYAEDCSAVLEWLAEAQPEVAAQCILQSGAQTPARMLAWLRDLWLPRLMDLQGDPEPEARAAIGRALGSLGLDDRPGVGLNAHGLPDIDWVEIPAGPFIYQQGERRKLSAFAVARYPITNSQYQAFIDDGGYREGRWWQGLAKRIEAPEQARWDLVNHPRETVSWFEAVAFCRWLSDRLGHEVRLPTELEWEKAARGTEGCQYPWGNGYQPGNANIDEMYFGAGTHSLLRTSPVGIYPQGASPFGVLDMCGNVWEWCRNKLDDSASTGASGSEAQVVRGGSWYRSRQLARATARDDVYPMGRSDYMGMRVCCPAVSERRPLDR